MEARIIESLIASACGVAGVRVEDCCSSILRRAKASSRRIDIHSVDLRLECWKMRITGVERRREVYCRWSCDLRYSGGLCDGGWVGEWRAKGGGEMVIWSREASGVIAAAAEAYRGWSGGIFRSPGSGWRHWGQNRSRGAIMITLLLQTSAL